MDRKRLEEQLSALPIVQYEFFRTEDLVFTPRVRTVCQLECRRYGTSWACPPGVGTVEACKARCLSYPEGLLIVTMTEVEDIADIDETLATRGPHEEITRQVHRMMRDQGAEVYVLSTESCAICQRCTYPEAPCRHPERMYPCVESHGILVTDLGERVGLPFQSGGNIVTWFSLLLYPLTGIEKGPRTHGPVRGPCCF